MKRRLAAILASDMAGFSRLMTADESGTIQRQQTHRDVHFDPTIAAHGGRIIKATGDSINVAVRFEAISMPGGICFRLHWLHKRH